MGFAVDKETNQIFLESRTIFSEESTAGAFWAIAGDVEPSLSLPQEGGKYVMQLQIAQSLNDETQLKDIEEGLLGSIKQIKQIQFSELIGRFSPVVLPQILDFGAELVAGVAPPKDAGEEQPAPLLWLELE